MVNAVTDWKPVQLSKNGSDVISLSGGCVCYRDGYDDHVYHIFRGRPPLLAVHQGAVNDLLYRIKSKSVYANIFLYSETCLLHR